MDGGKSKTEATHCPPMLEEASKMKNEAPGAEEEVTFAVDKGCITFTLRRFKCLGSLLTQDLKDNSNIGRQFNQATAQV
jgi:hypothetical protein